MVTDPGHAKRALRAQVRERRRTRPAAERQSTGEALTANLIRLAVDHEAGSIAAYLSLPDEPGTRDFLDWAASRDLRILLPVSRADGLLDWAEYDGATEAADLHGMPTPTTDLLGPIAINDVDLILVPAACVDRSGVRMGWGRGYFDRMLGSMENSPPVYAVIFDDELLDSVPRERHDVPVDGVVTPSGIIAF